MPVRCPKVETCLYKDTCLELSWIQCKHKGHICYYCRLSEGEEYKGACPYESKNRQESELAGLQFDSELASADVTYCPNYEYKWCDCGRRTVGD